MLCLFGQLDRGNRQFWKETDGVHSQVRRDPSEVTKMSRGLPVARVGTETAHMGECQARG